MVTGEINAFKNLCDVLPDKIDEVLKEMISEKVGENLVVEQLKEINPDIIKSMFMLAFGDYEGFNS